MWNLVAEFITKDDQDCEKLIASRDGGDGNIGTDWVALWKENAWTKGWIKKYVKLLT